MPPRRLTGQSMTSEPVLERKFTEFHDCSPDCPAHTASNPTVVDGDEEVSEDK